MPAKTFSVDIPSDPAEWDAISIVDSALSSLLEGVGGKDGHASNLAYLGGDHVQRLKHWKGPGERTTGGELVSTSAKNIERGFVGIPEAEKCVGRRKSGVCGTEADFKVAAQEPAGPENEKGEREPTEDQQRIGNEYKAALGKWWTDKGFWEQVGLNVVLACTAPQACLRVFINPASLTEGENGNKQVSRRPFREALDVVECVAEWPAGCGVYVDPDTLRKVGIWRGKDREGIDIAEVWFARDGKTVLRRLRGTGANTESEAEREYDWGGLIPILPLSIGPLLTEPVRDIQAAIDTTATGLLRLLANHNYPERNEINTMPGGEWKDTPPVSSAMAISKKLADGSIVYLHESDRVFGDSVTNSLVGLEHTIEVDDAGKEKLGLTTPTVLWHEPSDPENSIKGINFFTQKLRDACWQGHITDGSTAEASGDAYEQKRAEFEADLDNCANALAMQIQHTLTIVTVIAEWIAGSNDAAFPRDWTVDVSVVTDAGPVSSDKIQQNNASVQAGTLSQETALQHNGVRDVPAELERINESRALGLLAKRVEIANLLRQGGADAVQAYKSAGFNEEEATALARSDGGFVEQ